ncbi:tetratricopeptide repeat protein 19, mitochondrial-like [Mytilus galloprovincialis]|uniref:tetratricopeptide repeat protein 19, mitochondrial-like n=1 Tax=Mytilus galloprovincialis TaxID=29158 RepID=UPI003F7C8A8D
MTTSGRTVINAFRFTLLRCLNELKRRKLHPRECVPHHENTSKFSRTSSLSTIVSSCGLIGVSRCFLGFSSKTEEDPIVMSIKRAKLAAMRNENQAAERIYHEALYDIENKFKSKEMEREEYFNAKVTVYDDLANIALNQRQFSKAEVLYKETMKACLQKGMEKTSNAFVEITIKLGSLYAMTKKDEMAEMGYREAVKIMELKVKENPETDDNTYALLGLALESYGRFLMYHKELAEAQPLLVRSESIARRVLGEEHPQRIVLLNDIATVQIMQNNLKEAESTLFQAVEVGTASNVPELPALYSNLGAIYLRTSKLNDAEKNCGIALKKAKENKNKHAQGQAEYCLQRILEERKKGVQSAE